MNDVGKKPGVSIHSVSYFMTKYNLKRRTLWEEQLLRFEKKKPTFELRKGSNKELVVIGSMLYWGEGYKGDDVNPAKFVDFANSDPDMISVFVNFMRSTFKLDESKLRILLYCYSNQDIKKLKTFWSQITRISLLQFTKPYIRTDFKSNSRKMKCGLIHIRYHDKKLLLEMKKMIDS